MPAAGARCPVKGGSLVRLNVLVEKPNALSVVEITFVPALAGFLFLTVVMMPGRARGVGWAFPTDLKRCVVLGALDLALHLALAAPKPGNVPPPWWSRLAMYFAGRQ